MTGRYILKIAKKVVLRELKPEIAEKERSEKEKKEEPTGSMLKVRIVGKEVEKKEEDEKQDKPVRSEEEKQEDCGITTITFDL